MHQFGWLSERGGNFLKFASERGGYPEKWGSLRKCGGVQTWRKLWLYNHLSVSIIKVYGICMEYFCHARAGAPSSYLELLDKLQKWISLATSLEPLAHHQNAASLSLFYRHYFGKCWSKLVELVPLPISQGRPTCYSDSLHDFSVLLIFLYFFFL